MMGSAAILMIIVGIIMLHLSLLRLQPPFGENQNIEFNETLLSWLKYWEGHYFVGRINWLYCFI